MNEQLAQALQQELDELFRQHDPEEPILADDSEFALAEEEQEAADRLARLCAPPAARGIVSLNNQAWSIDFHKAFAGLGLAILQMGGGILFSLAGIVQAILILRSCLAKLNKAEVFLIALLADADDHKLDLETLRATFLRKGYSNKGHPETIFQRALTRLEELSIIRINLPNVRLAHTVVNLPPLKTMPRPNNPLS